MVDDLIDYCEDHPERKATHTLAGIGYLCAECAEGLHNKYHSSDGAAYPVLPIRPPIAPREGRR